jgi:hypothetical protein
VTAAEPFPKLLRRALLWPFAVFAAGYLLALLGKQGQESKVLGGLWLVATAGAALVELIAVPAAVVLLVRDAPRYTSGRNILLTLVAGLPVLVILLIVLLFSGAFGTFHI